MFNRLKYKVTFSSPAKTFEKEIEFNTGLTGITGQNGQGKSLILEMAQYGLFGSVALRGKADDYTVLETDLDFTIRDTKYSVSRKGSRVTLAQETKPLATGTKPVNAAIIALLGYSFDVFQVANAANQGKIEELGNMKPTERRKLIDETVGLNALDKLTEFIQKEALVANSSITALESVLVEPTVPVKPNIYIESAKVIEVVSRLIKVQKERDQALFISKKALVEPELVELEKDDALLDSYKASEVERLSLLSQCLILQQSIDALPVGSMEVVNLHPQDTSLVVLRAQAQERLLVEAKLKMFEQQFKLIPKADVTEAQIVAEEALQLMACRWDEQQLLLGKTVEHECPACEHVWDEVDPALEGYKGVPAERPVPWGWTKKHMGTLRAVLSQQTQRDNLEEAILKRKEELEALKDQSAVVAAIEAARTAYAAAEESRRNAKTKAELAVHIKALQDAIALIVDRANDVKRIEACRILYAKFQQELSYYIVQLKEVNLAKEALKTFNPRLDEELDTQRDLQFLCRDYELLIECYAKDKATYDKTLELLTGYRKDLADWKAGKEAVVALRAKVKGFLLPSLNSVASHLLNEMTGGELSWMTLNDQFEIIVEGTRLECLSGAGKSVANLALRLALGQVLTNRVFSVALLDEIDGSFDDERAAYTTACLRRLTGTIKQLVQVSHKTGLEADQYIRM